MVDPTANQKRTKDRAQIKSLTGEAGIYLVLHVSIFLEVSRNVVSCAVRSM